MPYNKGKHIIASLSSSSINLVAEFSACKAFLDLVIVGHKLVKLGEVYHNFLPQGFTAVVCLSESHISIHTWPEIGLINLDIYLSNFERNNDNTVEAIFSAFVQFFDATIIKQDSLLR